MYVKKLLVSAVLLFTASVARSQCSTNFSMNDMATDPSAFQPLNASEVPNGVVTASISVDPGDGHRSHNVTVGPNQTLTFVWTSKSGSSGSGYYTVDGGGHSSSSNYGLSGNWTWTTNSSNVGHTYTYWYAVVGLYGQGTTSDRDTITVVSTSGISAEDELPENQYIQASSTVTGSYTVDPNYCPAMAYGGTTYSTYLAQTLTNSVTGEAHSTTGTGEMYPLSGTNYTNWGTGTYTSFLPGDTGTVYRTSSTNCQIVGLAFFLNDQGSQSVPSLLPVVFRTKSHTGEFISTTPPIYSKFSESPFCINVTIPIWDPSVLTVYPANAIPPAFTWSENIGYKSPLAPPPGWVFPHPDAEKVWPAFFPTPGLCTNPH